MLSAEKIEGHFVHAREKFSSAFVTFTLQQAVITELKTISTVRLD
jgi:hypothetical protein